VLGRIYEQKLRRKLDVRACLLDLPPACLPARPPAARLVPLPGLLAGCCACSTRSTVCHLLFPVI
jgi:hypothetical protein